MESLSELRKICQTAPNKERGNIYAIVVSRTFSIFITRLLLPTGMTANQASVLMIVVGLLANFLFLFAWRETFLAGALLLQLWYILDGVDGEIARYHYYKRTGTLIRDKRDGGLTGQYLDMINHYIINFLVPATLSFGLYHQTGHSFWILIGFVASLTQVLMLAMHDARSRAQLTMLKRFSFAVISGQGKENPPQASKKRSVPHRIFMILHNTLTYPSVMNYAGIAAILDFLTPSFEWRVPLLFYWAFGTLTVITTLVSRAVTQQLIEEEFRQTFRVADQWQDLQEAPAERVK